MRLFESNAYFNISILCLTAFLLCLASCKDDPIPIAGCTDPESLNFMADAEMDDGSCIYLRDKIIGDWEAEKFFLGVNDAIASGIFSSITFEFEADNDFEWRALARDGTPFSGQGEWVVDGDFIEIEFDSGSDTFCGDSDHRFSIDFDGDDELNLEDSCNDGTNIKIELDRS